MEKAMPDAGSENLAHFQNDEWLARRPKASEALMSRALDIIDRPTGNSVDEFDKVPSGYRTARRSSSARTATARHRN
jgi:hypothetical protein